MSVEEEQERSPETYYAFKPSLVGAPSEALLFADRFEWRRGRLSGRIFYGDIRKVRLAYRPVTTENYRFVTEIWSKGGPKITLASTSWSGIVQQERHNAGYTAFVTELHRRIAAAGGDVEFHYGSPALLYWPGVAVFVGFCVGIVALAFQAAKTQAWIGFALVTAMMLFFLWQTGMFFWRNRPGRYSPDALPPLVMP